MANKITTKDLDAGLKSLLTRSVPKTEGVR